MSSKEVLGIDVIIYTVVGGKNKLLFIYKGYSSIIIIDRDTNRVIIRPHSWKRCKEEKG